MNEIIQSIDPAHGDIVGEVAMTAVEEIPAVVARSRAAQGAWAAMGARARATIIQSATAQLHAHATEIGTLISREMGKPLNKAALLQKAQLPRVHFGAEQVTSLS